VQSGALEFHRLPEYADAFFSSNDLPASVDSNPDLDCEVGDNAPNDADADNDGMPDGCPDFVAQLGLIPQGARDLLEGYHCGNHHADENEACDDWLAGDDARVCSACHPSQCGDGIVEPGEQCDDGNSDNEDDCSNDCHFTTRCGDGYVHKRGTPPYEQCDEGEYNAPSSPDFSHHCLPNCIQARCGDGHIDVTAEECDQGPANDDAGDCTTACTRYRCGDGKLHTRGTPPYEQCDDGNTDDHDTCLSTCVPARCGDGIQNCPPNPAGGCTAEVCDDGNNISGDGCNASCSLVDSEDFQCNHIFPLDQTSPSVGIQPSGGFVIAWEDKSEFGPDVSAQAVRARLFEPDGGPRANPISGDVFEFEVNTTTPRAQKSPSVGVSAADGRFVIVFEDQSELGSCITTPPGVDYTAVRGRLFAPDGTALATSLADNPPDGDWEVVASVGIPRHPPADMTNPQVVWSPTGDRFLVVWEYAAFPTFPCGVSHVGYADVYGRMFDRDGSPMGPPFKMNTTDANPMGNLTDQGQPQAAFFDDGSFVAVWQDASQQPPDTSGTIRARLFTGTPDGSARVNAVTGNTNDFVVPTLTETDQNQPLVATQPNGFVVVWSDPSQLGHDTDILAVRARMFSPAGAPRATPLSSHYSCGTSTPIPCCATSTCDFQVNTTEQGLQQAFAVTSADDGSFLIAFIDQSQLGADESSSAIRGRVFYADGTARPTTYASGIGPGSWAATDDFVINTRTQYSQFSPSAAARSDGSCVVGFADNSALGPDTYPWGIRARILFQVLGP
jgi:cysteine-rich repeat protein